MGATSRAVARARRGGAGLVDGGGLEVVMGRTGNDVGTRLGPATVEESGIEERWGSGFVLGMMVFVFGVSTLLLVGASSSDDMTSSYGASPSSSSSEMGGGGRKELGNERTDRVRLPRWDRGGISSESMMCTGNRGPGNSELYESMSEAWWRLNTSCSHYSDSIRVR